MRALVFSAIRELTVQNVPDPKIVNSSDVLVRIRACGVCGSDIHGYTGQSGRRIPPLIMGHEASGEVVEVAPGATRFQPGDMVAIQPWLYCGVCSACMEGRQLFCPERKLLGMNVPGALAEYVVVPEVNLFRPPDAASSHVRSGVSFEHAALAEPVAVALHAVGRTSFKPYETAAVIGAGPIGLLVITILRTMGLRRLIAIDLNQERLALAKELGADVIVNPSTEDTSAICRQVSGAQGVDQVFEAVGVSSTFQLSTELVRPSGQVIWIGNNQRHAKLDVQAIVTKESDIRPSYAFSPAEFGRALVPLADGVVPADRLITRRASLDEGPTLFEELIENPGIKCLVAP